MAKLRSWTQIWRSIVGVCILNFVLNFKIVTLADDTGSNSIVSEGDCKNTNYQIFLPPPYQNISSTICKPVWRSYELRVSSS